MSSSILSPSRIFSDSSSSANCSSISSYAIESSATAENPSWDSFLVDFDKTQKFETLTVKFEVVKSDTPLNDCTIQFNDWAESEPENSDALIQHHFAIGDRTGVIEETVTIDKDLSKGLGTVGLMFDRTVGAGEVEILVKEVSLNK